MQAPSSIAFCNARFPTKVSVEEDKEGVSSKDIDMHGDVSCDVWNRTSQLRRTLLIDVNHTFRQHRTHEISCFYVTVSNTEIAGSFPMTRCDILGGGVCTVRRLTSQLRRALFITDNHAFTRRHAHEILSFKVAFHAFMQFLGTCST